MSVLGVVGDRVEGQGGVVKEEAASCLCIVSILVWRNYRN